MNKLGEKPSEEEIGNEKDEYSNNRKTSQRKSYDEKTKSPYSHGEPAGSFCFLSWEIELSLEEEIEDGGEKEESEEIGEGEADGNKGGEECFEGKQGQEAEPEHDEELQEESGENSELAICFPVVKFLLDEIRHRRPGSHY